MTIEPFHSESIGVVVEFDGKFWGVLYEDSQCRSCGWTILEYAIVSDPRYCKRPEDNAYVGSPDLKELSKGRLRQVRVVKTIEVLP